MVGTNFQRNHGLQRILKGSAGNQSNFTRSLCYKKFCILNEVQKIVVDFLLPTGICLCAKKAIRYGCIDLLLDLSISIESMEEIKGKWRCVNRKQGAWRRVNPENVPAKILVRI